jgi:predicted phosphodiesterase
MIIIGDVHGKHSDYLSIIKDADYSIQVGDFGFNYSCLNSVDKSKHKIIPGNHDNYDELNNWGHFLHPYGQYNLNNFNFFYVAGEHSIDWPRRTEGVNWWRCEELSYHLCERALKSYKESRPRVMITHGCPNEVKDILTNGNSLQSRTSQLFSRMLEVHVPDLWVFGHYHVSFDQNVNGCRFVCLNELEVFNV